MSEIRRVREEGIDSVYAYPLKGAKPTLENGKKHDRLRVTPTGLAIVSKVNDKEIIIPDRSYMIVPDNDEAVRPAFPNRDRERAVRGSKQVDQGLLKVRPNITPGFITFSHPEAGTLELPTTEPSEGDPLLVLIQKKLLETRDQGKEARDFFSEVAGEAVQFVRIDPEHPASLPDEYRREGSDNVATAVDSSPLMLGSWADLERLKQLNEVDESSADLMKRFRLSMVMGGFALEKAIREQLPDLDPYHLTQDFLIKLRIGELVVRVLEMTERQCYYPNINPNTLELDGVGSQLMNGRYGTNTTGNQGLLFTTRLSHAAVSPDKVVTIGEGDPIEILEISDKPRISLKPRRS